MKVECAREATAPGNDDDDSANTQRPASSSARGGSANGNNRRNNAADAEDCATMAMEVCKASSFLSLSVPVTPTSYRPSPLLLSPIPSSSSSPTAAAATVSPPRRKASAPVIGTGIGQIHVDCLICSDRATGKHYGSISCDGCKGFFRRTIRKKHNYVCRFNRNCVVDKNQRNSCRRCRFDKCLANGMRPEAVQLERDRIAATRRSGGTSNSTPSVMTKGATGQSNTTERPSPNKLCTEAHSLSALSATAEQTLQRLMEAERKLSRQATRGTAGKSAAPKERTGSVNCKTATTGDVTDSMHQQLILLVEWAKQLEEFRRLPLRSQIALLRHFSGQHLVLCAAFRSLVRIEDMDAVWLANDRYVPRDAPKIPDVNRVVARILDHLTGPMRRLRLEEREFVALKAVAFFDPMAKEVEESSINDVEETRRRILGAFEHQVQRVSEYRETMPLRLANLLLLLPPLMAIARDLVEEAQLAKLFGLANVDELMAELLLPEDAETRSYSRLRTSVTSSIVQSNVTSPTPPSTSPRHSLLLPSSQFHQQQHSPAVPITTAQPPPHQQPETASWECPTVSRFTQNTNSDVLRLRGTLHLSAMQSQMLMAPTPLYSSAAPLLFGTGASSGSNHHRQPTTPTTAAVSTAGNNRGRLEG